MTTSPHNTKNGRDGTDTLASLFRLRLHNRTWGSLASMPPSRIAMKKPLLLFFLLHLLCLLIVENVFAQALDNQDPRYKDRNYRRFLLPNQMKVLLISDPTIQHAAVSLSVAVGALSDPPERLGMAHFLEHMLFLGTEKYPEAGEYQRFVSRRGGYTNAYTTLDHTNYHFEINPTHLEGALDRFAQFFIAPLFNQEFVSRELKAVDSEHAKNLATDSRRIFEIQKSVYTADHPMKKFMTGNLATLTGIPRQELLDFYEQHYSANLMTLAVIGKENLDELQQMVVPRFHQVTNRNRTEPSYPTQYLPTSDKFRLFRIQPVKDIRTLSITFALPPTQQYYQSKPLRTISFLIGHEGEGSLLSQLKKENLVTSLFAGGGGLSTNSYSNFSISMQLTPRGVKEYETVIDRVYQYLRLLRKHSLPQYIYDEIAKINEINYRFEEKQEGTQLVSRLSALMLYLPLREVEVAPYLLTQYNRSLFDSMLYRLIPQNMVVTLVTPSNKKLVNSVEPYYGGEYSFFSGKKEAIKRWRRIKLHPQLKLPKPNDFIPKNLTVWNDPIAFRFNYESLAGLAQEPSLNEISPQIVRSNKREWSSWNQFAGDFQLSPASSNPLKKVITRHAEDIPTPIIANEKANIWFQPDFRFDSPKAHIKFRIHTLKVYDSARSAVLAQLYVGAVFEGLNEFLYPVSLAGLDFTLSYSKEGISLEFSGYSDRILDLIEQVSRKLKKITIDQKAFEAIREHKRREYQNFTLKQPYQQAFYYRNRLLEHLKHSIFEYEQEIQSITLQELKDYVKTLYQQVYIEGLAYGNLQVDQVTPMMETFLKSLGGQLLAPEKRFVKQTIQIPVGQRFVYTRQMKTTNSVLFTELQMGEDQPQKRAVLAIIAQALKPLFYTELRTKQQTGYIVSSGMVNLEDTLSLYFIIQSGKYPAAELDARIDAYLPKLIESLQNLSQEEFDTLRQSILRENLNRPTDSVGASGRLFEILFEEEENFEYKSENLQALEQLTRERFLQLSQQYLDLLQQKRLSLGMIGQSHQKMAPVGIPIENIADFKKQHPCPQFCLP